MSDKRRPNMKWYQDKSTLHLIVDHRDVDKEQIDIEEKAVKIKFTANDVEYEQNMDLC